MDNQNDKKMRKLLITLIIILIPVKSFGLIEVDITRGNLNPLPIAVSPLSIDEESRKNFENKVYLYKGNSNKVLKNLDIKKIDFAFIDGGHSYQTTLNDIEIVHQNMKGKKGTIVCDDYQDTSYITDVKKAIDYYVKKENLSLRIIEGKFAVIEI